MANEITYSGRLSVSKSNLSVSRTVNTGRADMAGDAYVSSTQSIPTTAGGTAVNVASTVATPGWAIFKNLDATNYVEVGVVENSVFRPFIKLLAGQSTGPMPLGVAANAIYAMANTAACILEFLIVEA